MKKFVLKYIYIYILSNNIYRNKYFIKRIIHNIMWSVSVISMVKSRKKIYEKKTNSTEN